MNTHSSNPSSSGLFSFHVGRSILFPFLSIFLLLLSQPHSLRAQSASIAANAADMLELGTIGLEASVGLSRHWTLNAGAKLNPWTFRAKDTFNGLYSEPNPDQVQDRRQTYHLGGRYWPWNIYSGLWAGARAQWEEYSRGGLLNDRTEEGDALGLSVSAGYSLMVKEHINLDFGAGIWAGRTKYTTYECPRCGKVLSSGNKWFLLPSEIVLSFVYVF